MQFLVFKNFVDKELSKTMLVKCNKYSAQNHLVFQYFQDFD